MPQKVFTTPEGTQVQDEAIEVEPIAVSNQEPIVWEYDDDELALKRVVLHPDGVRLWKAVHEMDGEGNPLMTFEPHFEAESRDDRPSENEHD